MFLLEGFHGKRVGLTIPLPASLFHIGTGISKEVALAWCERAVLWRKDEIRALLLLFFL